METLGIMIKAKMVVRSCHTLDQLDSARKYVDLVVKNTKEVRESLECMNLISKLKREIAIKNERFHYD